MDLEMEEDEEEATRCSSCMSACRQLTTFFLSHVGLISLVVGYCIIGAFTFEALEYRHELAMKENMTKTREALTHSLWLMTEETELIRENDWVANATNRLLGFEREIINAMKKGGWDGNEKNDTLQWTFSGALFYSIVVITTIGYGHIAPKTMWGKIVTIVYAILGIPLMLLTLSHIGDFLAKAFRFLYWRVCCFMCTRRPRPVRRAPTMRRGRSVKQSSVRNSGGNRGIRRSAIRRSARISQRSADSAMSDSFVSNLSDPVFRRAHSDEDVRVPPMAASPSLPRLSASHLRPFIQPSTRHSQRSSRSAEPMFPINSKNLPVLFNKYAEDTITTENELRKPVRLNRLRPQPTFVVDDYWPEEEEYYDEEPEKRPVPIWLCVFLVIAYILSGAFLFSGWEGWQFLDAAYFCFITLTTIGFGDFVPAQRKNETFRADEVPEVSIALCSLYLLFGISLLAMSFNLVQEEVIHSVKQVAARLGIISEEE